MKNIEKALTELRRSLIVSKLFNITIDALVVFLIFFLVFILMSISWFYTFIPTVIYLAFFTRKKLKSIKYLEVEKKVPLLQEKLRTAADNVDKDNEIVNQLHNEVIREMKLIRMSMFLDPFKNTMKIGFIGVLAFAIVLSASLNVMLFDFDVLIKDIGGRFGGDVFVSDLNITFEGGNENIYGEESIIDYGSEELNLGLNTMQGELDFERKKEAENLNFHGRYITQEDLKAISDSSYIEKKLAKDEEEIVKRYFNQITR
ncbi:MAG: hypothetical protein AABW87_02570 [Nanoarchaeota archaeon]